MVDQKALLIGGIVVAAGLALSQMTAATSDDGETGGGSTAEGSYLKKVILESSEGDSGDVTNIYNFPAANFPSASDVFSTSSTKKSSSVSSSSPSTTAYTASGYAFSTANPTLYMPSRLQTSYWPAGTTKKESSITISNQGSAAANATAIVKEINARVA